MKNYKSARWSSWLLILAVTLMLACRGAYQEITTGPGDPKLTYELVSKNVNAYKGNRVRWCGTQLSFESTGAPGGTDYITRTTYANVEKYKSFSGVSPAEIEAFVVEQKSADMFPKMPSGCVTGTIGGAHTIGVTLGSASGRERTEPKTVPLLTYPVFEGAENKN